jgi:PKD repeat protein/outer membrane murein-binding lipoprotein Lpp
MKSPVLFFAGLLLSIQVPAQSPFPCAVNDEAKLQQLTAGNPELRAQMAQAEADLEAFTQAFAAGEVEGARAAFTIPVVFHIIHNNGPENIPDANIYDAVRVLNEDFNKENADWANVRPEFLGLVADVDVEFVLARKDPNGNCTNGITRTVSALTNNGESAMKALIQWPRNKYLNIWVCANAGGAGVAGYTFTPNNAQFFPAEDGIVVRYDYVGTLPPSDHTSSRTLTHEVGHWINLQHTWGPSNNPGLQSNCNLDDNVADTPNTIGWTSCNLSGATCDGTLDNVENFMEYSFCDKMFTQGQKTRMHAALNSSLAQRNQLWTASNLAATGVTGPLQLCAAVIAPGPQVICAGQSVTFHDASYHGVTGRNWEFPGGSPSSSTAESPTVTYSTPGTYSVTLTATNGPDQLTTTATQHVVVLPDPGQNVPFTESFDAYSNLGESSWTVRSGGSNTFEITSAAAFDGTKSVRLVNTAAMNGQYHDLISGTYDMSDVDNITVSYRYAYARRNASSNDRLRVHVSNDCGQTWSLRQQLTAGNLLNTAGGNVTGNFVPSADQWAEATFSVTSATFRVSDFRLRFEFQCGGGNNVYIDHINLNGGDVGLEELMMLGDGLSVRPNPVTDRAEVVFRLDGAERVDVNVIDPTGRQVVNVFSGVLPAGEHRLPMDVAGLAPGMYVLHMRQGTQPRVVRFVVDGTF